MALSQAAVAGSSTTGLLPVAGTQSWNEAAELACQQLLAGAGSPVRVNSGSLDDQFAEDSYWAAALQQKAAQALGGIAGQPNGGASLIQALGKAAALNQEMGSIYNTHPVFSQTLDRDKVAFSQNAQGASALAGSLGTPTCATVAGKTAGSG
ncbi:hypothetical protein AB0C76_39655 [Kitasatospora sp. NPDC048722]|uniref:hypothetical protein n=1 Tax=Kitasatospora sp. NPDC048722 TaxID=3155639 RepID=UPI0033E5C815